MTRSELERLAAELNPARRALFALWRKAQALPALSPAADSCVVEGSAPVRRYALSRQQRQWLDGELGAEPDRPSHLRNMPFAIDIQGPLDLRALQAAADVLLQRHESLRCAFDLSERVAVVQDAARLQIQLITLDSADDLPRRTRELHVARFDFTRAPLMRLAILRSAPERFRLVVVAHHIVWDGWSLGLFLAELETLYVAERTGGSALQASTQLAAARPYSAYARWQRQWLESGEAQQELAYWRRQLRQPGPQLDPPAPTDRAFPERRTYGVATCRLAGDAPALAALKRAQTRLHTTSFVLLATAYMRWLARHASVGDIAISTNVAGRIAPELEHVVGDLTNIVVLRAALSPDEPFVDSLQRVREVVQEAFLHQRLPFGRVVESLEQVPDPSSARRYPALLFHNFPVPSARWAELRVEPVVVDTDVGVPNWMVVAFEYAGKLELSVQYNTDIYQAETVARGLSEIAREVEAGLEALGASR